MPSWDSQFYPGFGRVLAIQLKYARMCLAGRTLCPILQRVLQLIFDTLGSIPTEIAGVRNPTPDATLVSFADGRPHAQTRSPSSSSYRYPLDRSVPRPLGLSRLRHGSRSFKIDRELLQFANLLCTTVDRTFAIRTLHTPLPEVHLTPLPALARVDIQLYSEGISGRLVDLLPSVHSAPVLSSECDVQIPCTIPRIRFPSPGSWVDMDNWLARLASDRSRTEGGLIVMLKPWPEGNSNWEGYFPEFRMAGVSLQ